MGKDMKSSGWLLLAAVAGSLAACSDSQPPAAAVPDRFDTVRVTRGATIYRQNCASCHGARGEGAFNWQRQLPDGKWLPPPLDASGHAWHHPWVWLKQTIRDGTQQAGGGMPAWGGKLSETDIEDTILWFQSAWPDEVYRAWADINRRAGSGN
jgi:mono/diheme cytochrome c family protein